MLAYIFILLNRFNAHIDSYDKLNTHIKAQFQCLEFETVYCSYCMLPRRYGISSLTSSFSSVSFQITDFTRSSIHILMMFAKQF